MLCLQKEFNSIVSRRVSIITATLSMCKYDCLISPWKTFAPLGQRQSIFFLPLRQFLELLLLLLNILVHNSCMHIIHCYLCLQNCHFQSGVAKVPYLTRNLVSVCLHGNTSPWNLGKITSKYQLSLWSEDCAKVDMKHHVTMLTNNFVKYLNTCETYTKVLI